MKIIKETEDTLLIEAYIHDDSDSFEEWQRDKDGNSVYGLDFDNNFNPFFEVKITALVDKHTGYLIEYISVE